MRLLGDDHPAEVRRHLVLLTLARTAANAAYRFAPPFVASISRGFDVSLARLGVALSITELAGLVSPSIGRAVDRRSRSAAMVAGLGGVAAAAALAAASPNLAWFTLALLLLSPSKVLFDVGLAAWVADRVPYERRGRVIGLTETSWALGLLVGVTTMGLVASATSWRWGYATGAAAVAVAALATLVRLGPERPHAGRLTHSTGPAAVPRRAWLVVGTMFALMASSQCVFVTFGAWLEDEHGFSAAGIAAVGFGLGAVELVASAASARHTDRWGKERSTITGCLLMLPAGLALVLGGAHLATGLVLLAAFVLGFEFAIVSILPLAAHLVPAAPGRGLGLGVGAGTLGRATMAVTATAAFERFGLGAPSAMAAAWAGLAILLLATYGRLTTTGAGSGSSSSPPRAA